MTVKWVKMSPHLMFNMCVWVTCEYHTYISTQHDLIRASLADIVKECFWVLAILSYNVQSVYKRHDAKVRNV